MSAFAFTVTDILGETRKVARLYAWNDGGCDYTAYECPFCFSTQMVVSCENPGCSANPKMPPEAAKAANEKAERVAREEAQRERNHAWAMERIREDSQRRAEAHRAFMLRVQEAKGCPRCSDENRGKVRRHRGACPKLKAIARTAPAHHEHLCVACGHDKMFHSGGQRTIHRAACFVAQEDGWECLCDEFNPGEPEIERELRELHALSAQ